MDNEAIRPPKNLITKYIWFAIGILSLGILIGIGIAILLKETEGILGISSSIILSFLAVAFSYYQFYLNKFETEKREKENQKQTEIRRITDMKLLAYKEICKESDEIIYDCYKICCWNLNTSKNIFDERKITSLNLINKLNSFDKRIGYYNSTLDIKLRSQEYNDLYSLFQSIQNDINKIVNSTEVINIITDIFKAKINYYTFLSKVLVINNMGSIQ